MRVLLVFIALSATAFCAVEDIAARTAITLVCGLGILLYISKTS